MKIYISVDMEGATGVVNPLQVRAESPSEYAFGCKMQLHDLKAVIDGAFEGGATEILVNDSHARMINVDVSQLPHNVRLISGNLKPLAMAEGIKDGCDCAFFVAYHAMAGTVNAILDHTVSSKTIFSVKLNGTLVGETGLNAAVCMESKVPVVLVTGDKAVCEEAKMLFDNERIVTCAVKEGRSNSCATLLPPEETYQLLKDAAARALKTFNSTYISQDLFECPYNLEITFRQTSQCDTVSYLPGIKRLDGRTIQVQCDSADKVWRWVDAAVTLASSATI